MIIRKEIPLSKGKLLKLLVFAILFVLMGVWMLVTDPQVSKPAMGNPFAKGLATWGSLALGFLGIWYFSGKLRDKRPGIVIDESGITDNSSAFPAVTIRWKDISRIEVLKVVSQKFLMLMVKDPQEYIGRQTGAYRRKTMKWNLRNFGTPIAIQANALQCKIEELQTMLVKDLEEYNRHMP